MDVHPFAEQPGNPEDQPGANVRMTIQETTETLGTTVEAVGASMHRGKYGRKKTKDGRVFVIFTPNQLMNGREPSEPEDSNGQADSSDQSSKRSAERSPNVRDQSVEDGLLAEELRGHLASLRAEPEARNEKIRRREEEHREEARRKDMFIAQLAQRIPEFRLHRLKSRETTPRPPWRARARRREVPPGSQDPAQRRSRLHRFFGFE
jgi:hypothetical protein